MHDLKQINEICVDDNVYKVISISLALLLLLSVSGISINHHFCKEQLVKVNAVFFDFGQHNTYDCCHNPAPTCEAEQATCNINKENKECPYCHDEEKELKIKDYFVTADFNFEFFLQPIIKLAGAYKILAKPLLLNSFHNPYDRFIPPGNRTSPSFLNRYLL
ncbi:MAG: HYC_CC_PP family protein [Bacteroidales bacterium]